MLNLGPNNRTDMPSKENKIKADYIRKTKEFLQGDIFADENGSFYILTNTMGSGASDEWMCVGLKDGVRWTDPSTQKEVLDGLTHIVGGIITLEV